MSSVTGGLHKADASVKGFGASASRVLGGLAVGAAAAGTAALVGMSVAGGKAAADLQQSVANISTIKPEIDTTAVFASLNEMQTRVPQTAAALGDSLYNVFSSVNVSQAEALKLTEEFARSAVGAQTSAETFGTAALGVMNAYGLAASDAAHISDVFFNTVNAGVVTGAELAGSLGPVTQSARAAGVSLDELGGFIAGVTKEGGPASQNINNLNNFLQKITTKDAQKELQALGVATTDATGAFRPTVDVLADLKVSLGGMTEAARANALQAIFPDAQARIGAQTLLSQLDFVKTAIDTNRESAGSAATAYEKMSETLNSQAKLGMNALMSLATTLGAAATPALTSFLKNAIIPTVNQLNLFAQSVLASADPMATLIVGIDGLLPGFQGFATVVGTVAGFISNNLVPALSALAAGTATYYTIHLAGLVIGLGLAEGGFAALAASALAATAAFAAIAIPVALVAAGVFLVTKRIQDVARETDAATAAYLEHDEALLAVNASVAAFNTSAAASTPGGQARIRELAVLNEKYNELTTMLLFLEERGGKDPFDEAHGAYVQTQDELAGVAREMEGVTERMQMQAEAQARIDKGLTHGTSTWSAYSGSVQASTAVVQDAGDVAAGTAEAIAVAAEQTEKLTTVIADAAVEGTAALGSWVSATLSFQDDMAAAATGHWAKIAEIDRELGGNITAARRAELETQRADLSASYVGQQNDRAAAYATEAAAHRAHLGEMLIETVNSWALMGLVPAERAAEMSSALATEYGLAASNSQVMFGQMIGHLMNWRDQSLISTESTIGSLQLAGETAIDTQARFDELTGEYIAKLTADKDAGLISAAEYETALANLPAEIRTQMIAEAQTAEALTKFDVLSKAVTAMPAITDVNVITDANVAAGHFTALTLAQDGIKPTMAANVTDNTIEVRLRFLALEAKRAAMALDTPGVNVTTDAPEATARFSDLNTAQSEIAATTVANVSSNATAVSVQMYGVRDAINSIPTTRTVTIRANIDPALQQHSPSPIEQVMAAIEEFAARSHTFKIDTAGLDKMKDILSIVNDLGGAGSSLGKLGTFEAPSVGSIDAFAASIDTVLTQLSGIAGKFKKEGLEHTATFADSSSKIASLIGTAVESLTKLGAYKTGQISQVLLSRFAYDVYESVRVLSGIAEKFETEGIEHAAAWSESAGKIIGIIGGAVDSLSKLGDYQTGQISQMALARFAGDVYQSVKVLSGIAAMFEQEGMEQAAAFAENAGSVISLIGDAVTSFQSLADYEDIATRQFEMLAADIDDAVWLLVQMARDFDQEGPEAAAVFATAVSKIIAPIGDAVTAFTALRDYTGIMPWMLDMLAADIRLTVDKMVDMAAKFDVEGVEAAAIFGTAVSKIIAPIKDAVDTFTALRDYEGVLPASVELIGNDIAGTVGLMTVIASQASTEGVAAAAVFSEAVEQVFAGLKEGIDALTALQEYEGIPQEKMDQFVGDMQRAFAIMLTMDVPAGEAIPTLLTNAGEIASALAGIGSSATSSAGAVVSAVGSVNSALASIPRTITVHINAVVDPALERHSPSIIEQTLMNIARLIETMPQLGSLLTDAARIEPQRLLDELIAKVQELESEQADIRNQTGGTRSEKDRRNERLTELDELIADAEEDVADAMAGMERAVTEGLFNLGSALGSIGSSIASYGNRQLTGHLTGIAAEIAAIDAEIAAAAQRSQAGFGTAQIEELMALENRRAQLVEQQSGATAEQLVLQRQLLALEEQRQNLNFLEQQQKLLDLIKEYGLDPTTILGGVELGLGASIGGITEAMTRALAAIVDQLNARIGTTPTPPATTNTYASMPNMLTMPNMTGAGGMVDNSVTFAKGAFSITVVAAPGEDPRELAERLMPEIDRITRERKYR